MPTTRRSLALPVRNNHWYGRRADLPDPRDRMFSVEHAHLAAMELPSSVDLRPRMRPKLFDQGALGSCVGNGTADAFAFCVRNQTHHAAYVPSRLFIYYGARQIEGSIASDAGCEIRDAIKVVAHQGAPHETLWPYRISRFAAKPPAKAYSDGALHQAITYARIDNAHDARQMLQALAGGFPILIGITVFDSFESTDASRTGIIPLPTPDEAVLGGHCMLVVGYTTDAKQGTTFITRNSWGASWGDGGYCYLPGAYLIDPQLASDFWVLSAVE